MSKKKNTSFLNRNIKPEIKTDSNPELIADDKLIKNECVKDYLQSLIRENDFWTACLIQTQRENKANKQIIEEKNNEIEELKIKISDLENKLDLLKQETISKEKYKELEKEADLLKLKNDKMAEFLVDSLNSGNELTDALKERMKKESKTKMQLSYLEAQNKRYQNIIEKVKNKWYGKISLKAYRMFFSH